MKFHWKVLLWMVAGAITGFVLQATLDAPAYSGAGWGPSAGGGTAAVSVDAGSPVAKGGVEVGDVVVAAIVRQGEADEERLRIDSPARDLKTGTLGAFSREGSRVCL